MDNESIQTEVNRLLQRGIVFGVIWIMGIGSVIAVISGVQALNLIKNSAGSITGKSKAVKCIMLGVTGVLIIISLFIFVLIYRKK